MENKMMLDEKDVEDVISYVSQGDFVRSDLINVLHKIQQALGYIPEFLQVEVARALDVPLSEVNGVVTFYSYFTTSPKGTYSISVCMGTACYVKGSQKIFDKFSSELGVAINETTADGVFTLEACRCIGACGLAPVITINENVHGQLAEKDVAELIAVYRKEAEEK